MKTKETKRSNVLVFLKFIFSIHERIFYFIILVLKTALMFMNILPCKPPLIKCINIFFLIIKYEDRGESTSFR